MREVNAPRVLEALGWFNVTHELLPTFGGAWWQQANLPRVGGVEVQEHWLMDAMAVIRAEKNAFLSERSDERRKKAAQSDLSERGIDGDLNP